MSSDLNWLLRQDNSSQNIRRVCPNCGNKGYTEAFEWVPCAECAATGRDWSSEGAFPCMSCHGQKGRFETVRRECPNFFYHSN